MSSATRPRPHRVLAVALPLVVTVGLTPWAVGRDAARTPAESSSVQAGPAESSSVQAGPAESSPAQSVPAQGVPAQAVPAQEELEARGRALYREGCASCHGVDGRGVDAPDGRQQGPTLENAGEASAFYYLSTGRMPLSGSERVPQRKPRFYTSEQIEALVAYVMTLGDGPELPEVDPEAGNLAVGNEVFRANCQACHSAAGSGGALSYGRAAPPLGPAEPQEVAAAVRVGPGQMPVFDADIISDDELDSLVAYVDYLEAPEDPGGLPIGRVGPIPEGFVAWLLGVVALLVIVAWIGIRNPVRESTET